MKERTIKEPKGKGKVSKADMKKAVKKVVQDKEDVAPKKDKKPAGGKNDKNDNSVGSKTGKKDGKSGKK